MDNQVCKTECDCIYEPNGYGYNGIANVTHDGTPCMAWRDPQSKGHNRCRNGADDRHMELIIDVPVTELK